MPSCIARSHPSSGDRIVRLLFGSDRYKSRSSPDVLVADSCMYLPPLQCPCLSLGRRGESGLRCSPAHVVALVSSHSTAVWGTKQLWGTDAPIQNTFFFPASELYWLAVSSCLALIQVDRYPLSGILRTNRRAWEERKSLFSQTRLFFPPGV